MWRFVLLGTLAILPASVALASGTPARSHPPLRREPPPATRPLAAGRAFAVDSRTGKDTANGSVATPWRTIRHALRHLVAGDTLYLRGGVFHENVYLALTGRKDAPITIRSYPGEQAILDGSLPEFSTTPATAWEPLPGGARDEYRSTRAHPNLRDVVGSFGDSMIGLQTYYHAIDFRSSSERVDWLDWDRRSETDIKPLWCGPGLWYDRASGRIHARLAHTNLPAPVANYKGETDPRKLPLVIAPFASVVLHVDSAQHVHFQDLILRGAGYTSILLDQASDVSFDNVTVWCGTYGMRVSGTRHLRFTRSALYGNVAPWTFRTDGSKRDYPGRPHRNISRLNTHALLEIDSGRESSVYATPQNDQWEIAYSEFTDAHDGLYLGAINVRFHHNLIDNLQDDGLYLSPMYHRHRLDKVDPVIHVHENVFRQMLTALAFGGTETTTRDRVFVYRNVFDLRAPINSSRPTAKSPAAGLRTGQVIGDHGSPPWPTLNLYHNTFVVSGARRADLGTTGGSAPDRPRRVFNNLFLHVDRLPGYAGPSPSSNSVEDGNLFWAPGATGQATYFGRFRSSAAFTESKKLYPAGSSSHSLVADPKVVKLATQGATGDLTLQKGSPAIDAGVALPEDWPDPLRKQDGGRPDVGASPVGARPLVVGRMGKAVKP